MSTEQTSEQEIKTTTETPKKKDVVLITMADVQEHKLQAKDLDVLGSARSIYNKGRASKTSSKGTTKKEETGVKATEGYKSLSRLIFHPAMVKSEESGKKPEEIAEAKTKSKSMLRSDCSKLTGKEVWDYKDIEKVVKASMKVLLDTPKPEKSSGD